MTKTILIITDNLPDQINGVVTTYTNIETCAVLDGYNFVVLHPGWFRYIDCPKYNEVKIAYPRKMGEKMLAPGEIERALGRSNPKRPAKHSSKFSSKRPIKSVPKGAGRNSGKGLGTGLRSFGKQAYQAPDIEQEYAHELFEGGGKQLEQYLANMSEDEQSKFTSDYADMLENPKAYKKNPFWVTPQGTAVHHSDKAWAGYQDKNVGVRLPAQAEREALLERQPTSLAPGFTVRVESMMTSNGRTVQAHKLFYKGRDTGKYALDGRKALEISHAIDPETGKRRKA